MSFNPESRIVAFFSRYLSLEEMRAMFAGPQLINTEAPKILGEAKLGSTLSCSPGTWGLPTSVVDNGLPRFEYSWHKAKSAESGDWIAVPGAMESEYQIAPDDKGWFLRCTVRGLNDGGFDEAADTNSNYVGPVGE